jgi:hypothetical protein
MKHNQLIAACALALMSSVAVGADRYIYGEGL